MATERFRRNSIAQLTLEDGRSIPNHNEKAAALWTAFKGRMGVTSALITHFALDELMNQVEGLEELTIPFTKQETDEAIKLLPLDKAPVPDGFNGLFMKSSWNIIAEDFYVLCQDFF